MTESQQPEQLQLFKPSDEVPEAWHLSRRQFEAQRGVVWRSEASDRLGTHYDMFRSGGVHFGTEAAARERGEVIASIPKDRLYPSVAPDQPVRLYSARTTGRFSNKPDNPERDKQVGWPVRKTGRWYRNQVEDEGSVSGYVPQREGFLQTHSELVKKAIAEGKPVHPWVQWEAEHTPEWSDTIQPQEPHRVEDRSMSLFPHSIAGKLVTEEEMQEFRNAMTKKD